MQRLLADVHAGLERVPAPRHLRRALAPLRALLQLLGARACQPTALRYALALLLRLLHTPCVSRCRVLGFQGSRVDEVSRPRCATRWRCCCACCTRREFPSVGF